MADQNIKDYTVTWITFGVLFFSLITFAGVFMTENNPTGLGDATDKFTGFKNELSPKLIQIETEETNKLLNSSAITESNADVGSVVAASNSYGFFGTAKTMFTSTKTFISWIFGTETAGQMISGVFFGLMGLIALFFIIKLGRSLF